VNKNRFEEGSSGCQNVSKLANNCCSLMNLYSFFISYFFSLWV